MSDDDTRAEVRSELDALGAEARKYTIDDLKSGTWFTWLLKHALDTYAKEVDAQYFETKYPGLNRDAIVERRIALAQRYAALAGGLSASAYSAAVIATLGSAGGASPIALPAAVASFAADLFFVSRLQLRLAYDLSVLYGHAIDLDDPEDLIDLVKVAFGIKAGEQLQSAVLKLAPEAVRVGIKKVVSGATLAWLQALPVVGKHLLQRSIIKGAIPLVAVPLSSGVNYFMTGAIAKTARQIYRDKGLIAEQAPGLTAELDDPLLFLEVVWLVVKADGTTGAEESWLLDALAREIALTDEGRAAAERFRAMVDCKESEVLERLEGASGALKRSVYEAACVTAAIDRKLHRKEKKLLERIAKACRIEHDPKKVEALIEHYSV